LGNLLENKNVSESQPERAVIRKGDVAMCDLIDANKRPTGEQIEVTIVEIRLNGDTPQSYRVYCKTERGTDKYIWVQAQFIHEKPVPPSLDEAEAQ
jgi:hypothetical protein